MVWFAEACGFRATTGPARNTVTGLIARCRCRGGVCEFAIVLGEQGTPFGEAGSPPAEASPEFFAGVAPLTAKIAPGSVWSSECPLLAQSGHTVTRSRMS